MSTPSTFIADRYRLVKMLGAGGMGVVWQAWDERLHRPVALKMLRTQPELSDSEREIATSRAMREARITAGLHHPHAVTVFDVVEHEGRPCIVMQLIESTPLSVLLREHGTLTARETARIGAEVGSALAAAHTMRIVHRDVKPGNILITGDGSAMISDFGISHALGDATITATGMIHGTPAYLSPELARGQPASFASDVFSLGSTMYTMLEGAPPFGVDNNAIALLHKVARGTYPAPRHAGALAPLLRDMLSANPKRRPGMESVAARLSAMRDGSDGSTGSVLPTVPLASAAAAAIEAADAPPTPMAETRRVGTTAETERLTDVPHETEQLQTATAETERLTGAAAFDELVRPVRKAPNRPPAARPVGSRPGPPPVEPPPSHQPPSHRRRRAGALVGILFLAGILLAGGGALLLTPLGQGVGTAGRQGASEAPTSTPQTTDATTPPETPSAEANPAPVVPSPSPLPDEEVEPAPASPEQRIVDTITNYYSSVPGDLDSAWPMMTVDYQVNHVGGRDAYNAFWGAVADVEVTDVSASPPDGARATLTYQFADGRVVQEVTAYRLVDEGGVLKIAATEVLSSVEL